MIEKTYDIIRWMEIMADSNLSKENLALWNDILSFCASNKYRVIITDEGMKRWLAIANDEGKIEYQIIAK